MTLPVEQVLFAAGLARALSPRTRYMPLHPEVLRLEHELRAALPPLVGQRALARALGIERHALAARVRAGEVPTGPPATGARRAGVPSGWAVEVTAEVLRCRARGGSRVLGTAIAMAEARRGRQ